MYKFIIKEKDETKETKGFNHYTKQSALDFISAYSDNYKHYFKYVWDNLECQDSTAQEIYQKITNAVEIPANKIASIKSRYALYGASAVNITKRAVSYMRFNRDMLLKDYDCPPETGDKIYNTIVSYPAVNGKNVQIVVYNGDNIRMLNYAEIDKQKRLGVPASVLGAPALYMELSQFFSRSKLTDEQIRQATSHISHSKIKIYGIPESYLRIQSSLLGVKQRCLKADSPCVIWFDTSSEFLGHEHYVYMGNIDEYVRFILGKACVVKSPLLKREDEGRCAPYLTNPAIIGKELPVVQKNIAGIDIGLHSLFTAAVYNNGEVKCEHFSNNAVFAKKMKTKELTKEEQQEAIKNEVNKLINYLKENNVKCVSLENGMVAKLTRQNNIRIPKLRPGVKVATKVSVSEEEEFFINLTGELIKALSVENIKVYAVETFNTSKVCSNCGELTKPKNPAARIFNCPYCGTKVDRDENAAKNMLNKLYSAEVRHKPICETKLNKKYGEAIVYCVGNCYEAELIAKAAV